MQLIRIQLRVPEYGWTTQKVFHLLNFIVCLLRSSVFVMREPVASLKPAVAQSILLDFPGAPPTPLLPLCRHAATP